MYIYIDKTETKEVFDALYEQIGFISDGLIEGDYIAFEYCEIDEKCQLTKIDKVLTRVRKVAYKKGYLLLNFNESKEFVKSIYREGYKIVKYKPTVCTINP